MIPFPIAQALRRGAILILVLGLPAIGRAQLTTVQIAGTNGTGTLSLSNVKNWASAPDPVTQSPYPYFFNPVTGLYTSISAGPLSASTTYAEEATYTVLNKINTQSDFATISAGAIQYDASLITGVGIETLGLTQFTLDLNTLSYQNPMTAPLQWKGGTAGMISPFSPLPSQYNAGSGSGNFGWSYVITPSNFAGSGLTFTDGTLTSIDFTADLSVQVRFLNSTNALFWLANPYNGSVEFSGNGYEFALDVTQDNSSALGPLTGTRMVFDRSGTIAAVVPEPSTVALFVLAGGAFAFRHLRRKLS